MAVGSNGCQGEHLGIDGHLEVKHQPHDVGCKLSYANTGYVGVIGLHFGDQLLERRVQCDAFNVHRQPRRTGHKLLRGGQCAVGLDGDARVLGRRPDAHSENSRATGQLRHTQRQDDTALLQQGAALHPGLPAGATPCTNATPVAVSAVSFT